MKRVLSLLLLGLLGVVASAHAMEMFQEQGTKVDYVSIVNATVFTKGLEELKQRIATMSGNNVAGTLLDEFKKVISYEDLELNAKALQTILKEMGEEEARKRHVAVRLMMVSQGKINTHTIIDEVEDLMENYVLPTFLEKVAKMDIFLQDATLGEGVSARRKYRALLLGIRSLRVLFHNSHATGAARSKHVVNMFSILDDDERESVKGYVAPPERENSTSTTAAPSSPPTNTIPATQAQMLLKDGESASSMLRHMVRERLAASTQQQKHGRGLSEVPFMNLPSQGFDTGFSFPTDENNQDVQPSSIFGRTASPTPPIPDSWNWVEHDAVGFVQNQGSCGGCWSFSATQVMQSRLVIAGKGNMTNLSNQEIISCAIPDGCSGGNFADAWSYAKAKGGVTGDATYPYTAYDSVQGSTPQCEDSLTDQGVVSTSQLSGRLYTEEAIKSEVFLHGPVSIGIATPDCFMSYSSGILTTENCDCYIPGVNKLDHAVVIVGYGSENGTDYWIVKNSWGVGWGMAGYVLLERNANTPMGMCGLLMDAAYPEVVGVSPECQVDPAPSYCSAALQGIRYMEFTNETTGEQQCVQNTAGAYTNNQCVPSADPIPVWGWVLIGIFSALGLVLLIALIAYCCETNAPPNAWYNIFAKPGDDDQGYRLLNPDEAHLAPVPNDHPDAFSKTTGANDAQAPPTQANTPLQV